MADSASAGVLGQGVLLGSCGRAFERLAGGMLLSSCGEIFDSTCFVGWHLKPARWGKFEPGC